MTSPNDELDLHGFTVAEAIERFVEEYNTRVADYQYGCWKVIHGYGSSGKGGCHPY
jgi:DNA-nicking Smr family endonuclease